jgi:hypothetical protein
VITWITCPSSPELSLLVRDITIDDRERETENVQLSDRAEENEEKKKMTTTRERHCIIRPGF